MNNNRITLGGITITGFVLTIVFFHIFFSIFEVERATSATISLISGSIVTIIILLISGVLKKFTIKGASFELSGVANKNDDDIKNMIVKTGLDFDTDEQIDEKEIGKVSPGNIEKINSFIEINQKIKKELDKPLEFNEESIMAQAGFYFKTKNYLKSIKYLDKILEKDPENFWALSKKGLVLKKQEEYKEAIIYFDLSLEIKKSENIQLEKAVCLFNLHDYKNALKILNDILDENPMIVYIMMHKGIVLNNMNEMEKAISILEECLKIEPKNISVMSNMVTSYVLQNNNKKAISILKKILKIEPNRVESLIRLSHFMEREGNEKEAIQLINKVLEIEPSNIHALKHKGETFSKLGKYEDAILIFDLGMKLDYNSEQPDILDGKGNALKGLGRYDDALECYNLLLEKKPMDSTIMYNKSCVYALMGKNNKSIELLETVIISDPKFKENANDDLDFKSLQEDKRFRKLISK